MLEPGAGSVSERFVQAMDGVPTAVAVLTTGGPRGVVGQTVTALSAVTDEPPTLLASIDSRSAVLAAIRSGARFRVNVLAVGHARIADAFTLPTVAVSSDDFDPGPFGFADWVLEAPGGPLLLGALASFECRLSGVHEVGGYAVVHGEVLDAVSSPNTEPLLSLDRRYRRVEELPLSVFPEFR